MQAHTYLALACGDKEDATGYHRAAHPKAKWTSSVYGAARVILRVSGARRTVLGLLRLTPSRIIWDR